MSKMNDLQARLKAAANPAPAPIPMQEPRRAAETPACRVGRVHIGAYLPADFKASLRLVQAQTGEDTQTILARALNDIFRAHKVPVVGE